MDSAFHLQSSNPWTLPHTGAVDTQRNHTSPRFNYQLAAETTSRNRTFSMEAECQPQWIETPMKRHCSPQTCRCYTVQPLSYFNLYAAGRKLHTRKSARQRLATEPFIVSSSFSSWSSQKVNIQAHSSRLLKLSIPFHLFTMEFLSALCTLCNVLSDSIRSWAKGLLN